MDVKLSYNKETNNCNIFIDNNEIYDRLLYVFSEENKGKKFVKGYKKRFIPDRINFITPTGSYNFGLTDYIINWIKKNVNDRNVNYKFDEEFIKRFKSHDKNIEIFDTLSYQLRNYQKEAVELALKKQFGLFVLGTGAGKSLIITSIIHNLFLHKKIKKALIVVPDDSLVVQFEKELINNYNLPLKITTFFGGTPILDENSDVIICNRPMLQSRFLKHEDFFKNNIDCIIVDECHGIKASNKISKLIKKIKSWYRYGFTGTLPQDRVDRVQAIGTLGPIRYNISSKELRDEGFLANAEAKCILLGYKKSPTNMNYQEEIDYVINNEERNNFIVNLVSSQTSHNSLVLVNRIVHGEKLLEAFKKHLGDKKKVFFIQGSVSTDIRENVKELMEKENDIICIAITKIFSTGINIKNLDRIYFTASTKSSITVVQSIGRGLRLHENKNKLVIYDIGDCLKYSLEHSLKRKDIYKSEQINYLTDNYVL